MDIYEKILTALENIPSVPDEQSGMKPDDNDRQVDNKQCKQKGTSADRKNNIALIAGIASAVAAVAGVVITLLIHYKII